MPSPAIDFLSDPDMRQERIRPAPKNSASFLARPIFPTATTTCHLSPVIASINMQKGSMTHSYIFFSPPEKYLPSRFTRSGAPFPASHRTRLANNNPQLSSQATPPRTTARLQRKKRGLSDTSHSRIPNAIQHFGRRSRFRAE